MLLFHDYFDKYMFYRKRINNIRITHSSLDIMIIYSFRIRPKIHNLEIANY